MPPHLSLLLIRFIRQIDCSAPLIWSFISESGLLHYCYWSQQTCIVMFFFLSLIDLSPCGVFIYCWRALQKYIEPLIWDCMFKYTLFFRTSAIIHPPFCCMICSLFLWLWIWDLRWVALCLLSSVVWCWMMKPIKILRKTAFVHRCLCAPRTNFLQPLQWLLTASVPPKGYA